MSDITEQQLNNLYDTFSRETQRIMNEIKNGTDNNKSKQLHKELNIIHNIELNILKLKTLRKLYQERLNNI